MRFIIVTICIIAGGFSLSGCGGGNEVDVAEESGSIVGVWERRYRNAAGQHYLDVLELKNDGSYSTHMRGKAPSDQGYYLVSGESIKFESGIKSSLSQEVKLVLLEGNILRLTFNSSSKDQAEWRRSKLKPNYSVLRIEGRDVPRELPALVSAALASQVRLWQEDALPTSVHIEEQPERRYEVVLTYYSPSVNQQMRITFSAFDIAVMVEDGTRAAKLPLPYQFTDLPQVIDSMFAEGLGGALKTADLRIYDKGGPAWVVDTTRNKGTAFSAQSGERIHGDVMAYVAQYESDWEITGELWSDVTAQWKGRNNIEHCWEADSGTECGAAACYWRGPQSSVLGKAQYAGCFNTPY